MKAWGNDTKITCPSPITVEKVREHSKIIMQSHVITNIIALYFMKCFLDNIVLLAIKIHKTHRIRAELSRKGHFRGVKKAKVIKNSQCRSCNIGSGKWS